MTKDGVTKDGVTKSVVTSVGSRLSFFSVVAEFKRAFAIQVRRNAQRSHVQPSSATGSSSAYVLKFVV
jgi:hypothetical protein